MCGRFALSATTKDIEKLLPGLKVKSEIKPKFNISPTQSISIIKGGSENILDSAHWGLIPSWAKDKTIGNKMFNARTETIDEKPSFRSAFKSRRCIIPATEFYEWKKFEGSSKKQHTKSNFVIIRFSFLQDYGKNGRMKILLQYYQQR